MTEADLQQEIIKNLNRGGVRLFRNNVGFGWLASRKDQVLLDGGVLLKNARRIKYGLEVGSSDLIGFTKTKITAGMVGKEIAIFTSIEVKGPDGRLSPDQLNWLRFISEYGGIAGVAYSLEDAAALVFDNFPKEKAI